MTRSDQILARLKDHPVIAIAIVIGVAAGGVAQFSSAVHTIVGQFWTVSPHDGAYQKLDADLAVMSDRLSYVSLGMSQPVMVWESQAIKEAQIRACGDPIPSVDLSRKVANICQIVDIVHILLNTKAADPEFKDKAQNAFAAAKGARFCTDALRDELPIKGRTFKPLPPELCGHVPPSLAGAAGK